MMIKKNKIAFLGIVGSYSYEACKNLYPDCDTVGCGSFAEIVKKVQDGEVNLGLLPVANSSAYRVSDVHNLLPNIDLHIIKEYIHEINHCLLGTKNAELSDLKEVYSHPQALMQCVQSCSDLALHQNSYADTATAALYVSEKDDKCIGAISSKLAGELYGLEVLRENLQDRNNNRTTFWVVQKELHIPLDKNNCVITLLITTKDTIASLYKVLGCFSNNRVNLLSIESYANVENADFIITIDGHINNSNVKKSLEELKLFTSKIKTLGVYNKYKKGD